MLGLKNIISRDYIYNFCKEIIPDLLLGLMCIREKEDSEVQTTMISRDYYIIKNYFKRVVNIVPGTIPDFSFNQICGHKGVIKEEKCSVR